MTHSEGLWTTKNEKLIPFKTEISVLIQDDENWLRFFLQITKWPINTTVQVLVFCCGAGFPGSQKHTSRWLLEHVYKVAKLPNADFDEQREKLIRKASKLASVKHKKFLSKNALL